MVNIESIEEIAKSFEESGNFLDSCWSLNRPRLWGYFFHSKSALQLTQLRTLLVRDGYGFVELEQDVSDYYLHVEKEDVHSAASLHKQLEEFAVLVEQFEIDSIGHNVASIRRNFHRSQFLKELKFSFPEISWELNKAKNLQMEVTTFCLFSQNRINVGDSSAVKDCFEILEKYFVDGNNALREALYRSFIQCVEFDCKEFENYWVLKIEPDATLPTNGGILSWKIRA
ncbi:ribonuclease E inhibitor RraB [Undibacterium sp.]|uniref:DUF7674 family protein n=1 Tax=Undibacterium sp. TaxID=1914977 RepID=UPI003751417B